MSSAMSLPIVLYIDATLKRTVAGMSILEVDSMFLLRIGSLGCFQVLYLHPLYWSEGSMSVMLKLMSNILVQPSPEWNLSRILQMGHSCAQSLKVYSPPGFWVALFHKSSMSDFTAKSEDWMLNMVVYLVDFTRLVFVDLLKILFADFV